MLRQLFFALAVVAPATEPLLAQGAAPAAATESPAASETPNDYTRDEAWLCRPGRNDACAIDHTTTVVATQGAMPSMVMPCVNTDARINATMVNTSPVPPRSNDAY